MTCASTPLPWEQRSWPCRAQCPRHPRSLQRRGSGSPGPVQGWEGQKRLGAAWPGASWSRIYCKMSISSMASICCCCCFRRPASASNRPALGGTAGFLGSAGLAATGGLGLGWGLGVGSAPRFRIWSKSSSTLGNQRGSSEYNPREGVRPGGNGTPLRECDRPRPNLAFLPAAPQRNWGAGFAHSTGGAEPAPQQPLEGSAFRLVPSRQWPLGDLSSNLQKKVQKKVTAASCGALLCAKHLDTVSRFIPKPSGGTAGLHPADADAQAPGGPATREMTAHEGV